MKKELNRYRLIEYLGTTTRVIHTQEEYEDILKKTDKYNNSKKSKYILGNITREKQSDGSYLVTIHVYNRLEPAMGITALDNLTSVGDEKDLIQKYAGKTKSREGYTPDIQIAYFENKDAGAPETVHYDRRIKYIPVLYSEDKKFLDQNYLRRCLKYHADKRDYGFFMELANTFCFHKNVEVDIEDLRIAIDRVRNQCYDSIFLYNAASILLRNVILEYDKSGHILRDSEGKYEISRRRLRDFGFFIRDYNTVPRKIVSPVKYNQSLSTSKLEELRQEKEAAQKAREEALRREERMEDALQEDYALTYGDQQEGYVHEDYEIEIDPVTKQFRRK